MTLRVRIYTPQRCVCDVTAVEVILPGIMGQLGVLEGHMSFITALQTGLLRIKVSGENKWVPIIVFGGIAEVNQGDILVVTVVANSVEEFNEIDLTTATEDVQKATLAFENIETIKERIEMVEELKVVNARLQGINYLSTKEN